MERRAQVSEHYMFRDRLYAQPKAVQSFLQLVSPEQQRRILGMRGITVFYEISADH